MFFSINGVGRRGESSNERNKASPDPPRPYLQVATAPTIYQGLAKTFSWWLPTANMLPVQLRNTCYFFSGKHMQKFRPVYFNSNTLLLAIFTVPI